MDQIQDIHHYHHKDAEPATYAIEVTRNTKGYNYVVKITGTDPKEIFDEMKELTKQLEAMYPKE